VNDERRSAPHVARNTAPILDVLRDVLPKKGLVLEVASGSGEQSLAFALAFPKLLWQPSDPDPIALASIRAWQEAEALFNQLPPVPLDARAAGWPIASAEAMVCINMVHISPWEATQGLMRGAGRVLEPGAPLYLYGPYRQQGVPTAPSNEEFDRSLKTRDPQWGLRLVEEVAAEAKASGLLLERLVEMPANNLSLVFRRQPPLL
jgi:SAM-dependent methyltransferase